MHFPIRDISRCHEYYRLTVLHTRPSAAMVVSARGIKIAMLAKSMPAAERELKICSDSTPNNATCLNESYQDAGGFWTRKGWVRLMPRRQKDDIWHRE